MSAYFRKIGNKFLPDFFQFCSFFDGVKNGLLFLEKCINLNFGILNLLKKYSLSFHVNDHVSNHSALEGLSCDTGNVENGGSKGMSLDSLILEVLDEQEEGYDSLSIGEKLVE